MNKFAKPALLTLSAWTVFIWIARIRNIADDEDLEGWGRLWRLGVSVAFIAMAVGVVILVLRSRRGSKGDLLVLLRPAPAAQIGSVLAVLGSLWWIVRGAQILLSDHEIAFKVVHSVLGIITVGLGAWVLSATSSPAARSGR